MNSVFVTGTDTEVGKTRISVALIELLQQQGLTVAGMKPIASGCEIIEDGLRNDDAMQLMAQSNINLPYELVNPYAFEPNIAPHIAAEQIGTDIDLAVIQQNFKQIKQQADVVVVEGAGGWLVPLNKTQTMSDLAISLDLSVILVVGIKLGCINHALLTVNAIEYSGLTLQGWLANQIEPNTQAQAIIANLQQNISAPCLGQIPQLEIADSASRFIKI